MCFGIQPCDFFPYQIGSYQISHSVVSDSLRTHESQHAKPPCPSPTPGVHSDSCPSSHWCHPAISSSVIPFFSCPQSLPASESFPMSQPVPSKGDQSWVFFGRNDAKAEAYYYTLFVYLYIHQNAYFNIWIELWQQRHFL